MNICTIIAKNYVAHARVLAESFNQAHPDGSCSVLVVDDYSDCLDPGAESFELIGIDEIGLPDAEAMAASYDVTEFSTAVKPWLLRTLLAREGVDSITYLDPDILIARPIASIAELAAEHEIVLTPHFTAPLPRDGRKPAEEDILIAGTYNLGFISLAASETAEQLLDWWSERLQEDCVIDPGNGLFVDQRWIDLVPGFWPHLHILRDPGFNVAYWNLPRRSFESSEGGYLVDGRPLHFFHFSGFDPLRPDALSKHQNRIEMAEWPALAQICGEYAQRLLASGYEEARTWSYGWDSLPNGLKLDRPARVLYRQGVERGEVDSAVFTSRGAKRFLSYLREVPSSGGVSRYARAFRDSREDLRQAFPDVDGRDARAFDRWILESAGSSGISPHLLPKGGAAAGAEVSAGDTGRERLGINLAGYLSSELGVGEAARQVGKALTARRLPIAEIDIPVEETRLPQMVGGLAPDDHPFDINLVCVNADMLPAVARTAPAKLFEGRHSAGLWFWEVERFPERWRDSFDYLDEVWTASEFVAEAIRPGSPIPVSTIRVPVTPVEPAARSRAELSMPDGFCFLFVFDFRSVFHRKNPLGVVEAFCEAFAPDEGASLLLKSVGGEFQKERVAELEAAIADRPDIHLLDGVVSAEEKNAMIANCDCYVSLHRSEGLGLTMAEAMYFGRPVIATGYSGNLDFMDEDNSYLVEYDLVRIGEGAEPYPATARWADPRLEHAAEQMRAVFDDREEAARRGARGAETIRASHSPEAAGEVLEERLEEVRRSRVMDRLGAPATSPVPAAVPAVTAGTDLVLPHGDPQSGRGRLHHLLSFEQAPAKGKGRLRELAKRLYMRLLRPFAAHQRRIDLSISDAMDELGAEVAAMERRLGATSEASADALREDLARLDRRVEGLDGDVRGAYAAQADELGEITTRLESLRPVKEELAALGEAVRRFEAGAEERLGRLEADTMERLSRHGAATDEKLERFAAQTEETFERDRAFVDALRTRIDRLGSELENAEAALRDRLEMPASANGGIKPYMADDRFAAHEEPALGTVIGFRSHAGNGSSEGYRGFEDLFRGPEEMIRERQKVFLPLVSDSAPVLDAGCGRGEFLDLLGETGIEARGVDLDADMVARCREKGLEVAERDLLAELEAAPPGSLGCIFSAQVIEHLDPDQLQRFFELSAEGLRPGGKLIVETVNPHCADALKAFWVDPTHRQPLFPETILALCQLAGFDSAHAFCPLGKGDWESDRLTSGEYAIVATTPAAQ